ncbi:MAG: AraC family transcriptional regulator [Spirochaetales bacterium]|nr:AraC family transcriptional regulator [Spirochaetales bacterium]
MPSHEFGGLREYYLIHVVEQGRGEFHCHGKRWTLYPGDAFVIFPQIGHLYRADEEHPWTYFWLAFSGDVDEAFAHLGLRPGQPIVRGLDVDALKSLHESFGSGECRNHPGQSMRDIGVANLFVGMIGMGLAPVPPKDTAETSMPERHAHSMMDFILTHYGSPITPGDVIDGVGLERSYASRIFKNFSGLSLGEQIRRVRIERARELLARGCSVKEAAYGCGFVDYHHFLKTFKRATGLTPSLFRKKGERGFDEGGGV